MRISAKIILIKFDQNMFFGKKKFKKYFLDRKIIILRIFQILNNTYIKGQKMELRFKNETIILFNKIFSVLDTLRHIILNK